MVFRILTALVVAYAALLRFDAVTVIHGPVVSPAWFASLQTLRPASSDLRPAGMTWSRWEGRYISDPYTYLQYAREPRGFFDAHRREPGFVFATRLSLWLFNDQDVAVSWASAAFSVLAVWATYLLGASALSRPAGIVAAVFMAIDLDLIAWGAGGWRDDAFMCGVLLTTHASLRVSRSPSTANAVWLGVIAGAVCLVRITAVSFVLPMLAILSWIARGSRRQRVATTAVAAATMLLLVGPYLFNCWRVFGDPLYSINVHADVYREAEGQRIAASQTARQYLADGVRTHPLSAVDTAIQGLTTYPFAAKWHGLAVWHRWLPIVAATSSLLGLVWFMTSGTGRLLLAVLFLSLIPYSMTWKLIGDWRFTMHTYPFYLLASGAVLAWLGSVPIERPWTRASWPSARTAGLTAAAIVAAAIVVWFSLVWLPWAVAAEALRVDGSTTVTPGWRDRSVFVDGWQAPARDGNVTARVSTGNVASIEVPTIPGRAYELVLRLDPYPPPVQGDAVPSVRVFAGHQPAGLLSVTYDPFRIGVYQLQMPPAASSRTVIRLLIDESAPGSSQQIRSWWVRVTVR